MEEGRWKKEDGRWKREDRGAKPNVTNLCCLNKDKRKNNHKIICVI